MRILIVDDDPDARALAERALAQEFPEAETHQANQEDVLRQLLAAAQVDVLISDFDLRWANGLQIYDMVKAAHPSCATVMYTGTGNEEVAVRAIKHGFDDYVVKGTAQLKRLAASARIAYQRGLERRTLEENRDLILKELYHRLHNNLQMVISLMHMTARSIADPATRTQVIDLAQRIQALSGLQEQFLRSSDYRSVDFGTFLRDLSTQLVGLAAGRITLATDIVSLVLPVDKAVPLGLISNEVITNAVRHGFPEGRAGTMTVSLGRHGEAAELTIRNDGVGLGESGTREEGLGMKLVRRLSAQIGAEVDFQAADRETLCRIRFTP